MELTWIEIKSKFDNSPNTIDVFEKKNDEHYNSLLEVVVNNASLIIVNKYLRILCSGDTEFENILQFNSKFKKIIGENKYVVAHDVFGGLFAITETGISYFSPDGLDWEDLEISYDGFIAWISTTNINEFYASFISEDLDTLVNNIKPNQGIHIIPFPWSKEYDVNTASKRIIPYDELLSFNNDISVEFSGTSTNSRDLADRI